MGTGVSETRRPARPAAFPALPRERVERAPFANVTGRTVCIRRDAEIYCEGSHATHIFKVISGAVRTCKAMQDGRRQIGEFVLPGDVFGWDGIESHFYTAEALADTVLVSYPRRAIEDATRYDQVAARSLRLMMLDSLSAAQRRMLLLARKTAVERVATFLLEMHERTSREPGEVHLPMTRNDIADHLGLTLETVSRVLSGLKQKGAITLHGAHIIRVANRQILSKISGEDGP